MAVILVFTLACQPADSRPPEATGSAGTTEHAPASDVPATAGATESLAGTSGAPRVEQSITGEDSVRVDAAFAWAVETHADTLPFGELVARIGRRFLGAPYVAGSLDPPGPERLVVNLRAFDCVTFVETTLALARAIRDGASPGDFDYFTRELASLRYRSGGHGYTDRLHYFSEWIAANTARGTVVDITADIGGERDDRPITFMSAHVDAYPQLADAAHLEAIRATERDLSERVRYYVPQQAIADVADAIRSGDVIAATSNVTGLDITHTGIAIRVDGQLHLMHAPLAGGVVEISERPLAERIQRISGQDGIMVARPR